MGANLAILDAVHLCNSLVDLPSPTEQNITLVFESYFVKRSEVAKAALGNARQFGKVMSDRVKRSADTGSLIDSLVVALGSHAVLDVL